MSGIFVLNESLIVSGIPVLVCSITRLVGGTPVCVCMCGTSSLISISVPPGR